MDWALAIERNREALRRILAMLVAMVGVAGGGSAGEQLPIFPQKGRDASGQNQAEKSKPSPALPAPSPPLRAQAAASGRSRHAAADHRRCARVGGRACASAPACRQAEAGPQPKQRFRHRCGDPARSAAGMGPCAGPEALFRPLAAVARPAQTVWWPPQVSKAERHAAHQVLRRSA